MRSLSGLAFPPKPENLNSIPEIHTGGRKEPTPRQVMRSEGKIKPKKRFQILASGEMVLERYEVATLQDA